MEDFFSRKNGWMIATIALALVLLITLVIVCVACSGSNTTPADDVPPKDEVVAPNAQEKIEPETPLDKDIYVVDTLTDANGYVIQKTVFNAVTKHTYIYTFTYDANAWGGVCSKAQVVIVNQDGTITTPSEGTEPELPGVYPVG